jgi:hypothetical protein
MRGARPTPDEPASTARILVRQMVRKLKVPADATTAVQKRRYYQANVRGFSNQGHQNPPQGLSDEDKRALIEYMKTL